MNEGNGHKTGVYICHCGTNIAGVVDVDEVTNCISNLEGVEIARNYMFMCSEPGQNIIRDDIKNLGLDRVVVASCSPRMHENTFRRTCQSEGLNPYLFNMVNIREHCSWITDDSEKATELAKSLISAGVKRVLMQGPLMPKEVPVNPNTLIVGAGIAGIQAALDMAEAGKKVYLVEREACIGGQMAKFDKTFPTLDCAACILTPKTVAVKQHPNIELFSYSEVEEVSGFVGNFKVKVRKKSRYIDDAICTACGDCVKECPVEIPNEFDQNLVKRKAVYRPFPQAIPNVFTIDKKDTPCKLSCPIEMDIQGYIALISVGKFQEAYELIRSKNPLPGTCGRICFHPCETNCRRSLAGEAISINALKRFVADYIREGKIKIPPKIAEKKKEKIAVMGSGPAGLTAANDLALMGYDVTIYEKMPEAGGMLRYGILDYRLRKKILNEEIDMIRDLGVNILTNSPINTKDDILNLFKDGYSSILISAGASESKRLNIEGADLENVILAMPFLISINEGKEVKVKEKVIVVGGGNVAIDASRAALRLGAKEVNLVCLESREKMPAYDFEVAAAEEEGVIINDSVCPTKFISRNGAFGGVETLDLEHMEFDAEGNLRITPIEGSESMIEGDMAIIAIGQTTDLSFVKGLDGTVISKKGTLKADEITLNAGVPGLFACGDVVSGPSSYVEAVASGHRAAQAVNAYVQGTELPEKYKKIDKKQIDMREEEIWEKLEKGEVTKLPRVKMRKLRPEVRIEDFSEVELGYTREEAIREALRCLSCGVCSECRECEKLCKLNAINHELPDEIVELDVGTIIVATGYSLFDARRVSQYGYGRFDNVITSLDFERISSASGPMGGRIMLKNGELPRRVGLVFCVGSRDSHYNRYCSRFCCMTALKFAHLVREKTNAQVYGFYIDMRSYGKGYEEFYNRILEEGCIFVRGKVGEITDVAETKDEEGRLIIVCDDTFIGIQRRIPVDMVILCAGAEAKADASEVAKKFGISRGRDGFFAELHPKLDPISTTTDGVFVAGCCQGPKDIPDTVAQGSAAASKAMSLIDRGSILIEPITAEIAAEICSGCMICVGLCPFKAIEYSAEDKVCVINESLCKGCGVCGAACPAGAITNKHYTIEQIFSEIEGALI